MDMEKEKKSVLDAQFRHPNDTFTQPYTEQQQNQTFLDVPQNKQPYAVPPEVLTAAPAQDGCFKRQRKYLPQTNAVGAAILIISTGGMNIASANGYQETRLAKNAIIWFVSAIIGAQLGAALINVFPKKYLMLVSSLLVVLGGVIVTSTAHDIQALLFACFVNGLAVGLALVPTLVLSGEVSVKERRGMLAGTVDSLSFSIGAFLQIVCSSSISYRHYHFNANHMHGIICIIFGIVSLIFVRYMVIESPVYLLLQDQEPEAIDSLRRLQYPSVETSETYALLKEHKHYIAKNKQLSQKQAFKDSLPALIRLCLYRGLVAMSCSIYINMSIIYGASHSLRQNVWAHIVFGLMRLIGSCLGVMVMDSMGRKKTLMFSLLPCAGMAIAVGAMYTNPRAMVHYNHTVLFLLFIFQLFAGIAATSSSAYLSEGFPMAVKSYCICIIFSVEMLLQSIMVSAYYFDGIDVFCIILGSFLFLFFVFTFKCLPETKNTTLREAQDKFKGYLS